MPIFFINPGTKGKSKKVAVGRSGGASRLGKIKQRVAARRAGVARHVRQGKLFINALSVKRPSLASRLKPAGKPKRAIIRPAFGASLPRQVARHNPARPATKAAPRRAKKGKTMAKRKKLFGAALAAHLKKIGKKVRKNPAKKARKAKHTGIKSLGKARKAIKRTRRALRKHKAGLAGAMVTKFKMRSNPKKARKSRRKVRHTVKHVVRMNPRRKRRSYRKNPRTYGVKAVAKARRTIRYQKKHGKGQARKYLSMHRMRSNPMSGFVDALKIAAPIAAGFFLTRVLVNKSSSIPMADKLGQYRNLATAAVGVAAMAFLSRFVGKKVAFIGKHSTGLTVGAALTLIDTAVAKFAPKTVAGYIAAPTATGDVYDSALADYYATNEPTPVADYIEQGEYVDIGASEELGASEALGYPRMLSARPIAHAATTRQIPEMNDDETVFAGMNVGVFASSGSGW